MEFVKINNIDEFKIKNSYTSDDDTSVLITLTLSGNSIPFICSI